MKKVTVIGAAIVDILAGPVQTEALEQKGSLPMDYIRMSYGGNGHNEAVTLSRLGEEVSLVTKVGDDETGKRMLTYLEKEGIATDAVVVEEGLPTGINVVLVDEKGERRFLTDPKGSLRKLTEEDVLRKADAFGDIVSFSGMFVSPMIDLLATERIFRRIKEMPDRIEEEPGQSTGNSGRILVVDMVKPKKGETIEDLKPLCPYMDYFLPNAEELTMLSLSSAFDAADKLLEYGVKHVILKEGKDGCRIFDREGVKQVPAYPTEKAVDTTGAGDSFVAGFIYGLCHDMEIEDCARFANAVASCSVEQVGATDGIVSSEEPVRRAFPG